MSSVKGLAAAVSAFLICCAAVSYSGAATLLECQTVKAEKGMTAFMDCIETATTDSSSGASSASKTECAQTVREDIDWVFRDNGALDTYVKARASGKGAFQAILAAQGHNPDSQGRLRSCSKWIADLVYEHGECGKIKEGVDWIFRDAGATQSYRAARNSGKSKFRSALFAQRHNVPFQRLMVMCEGQTLVHLGAHED